MCSVSEVAVVGPPDLYRVGFQTVDPLAMLTMGWVRSPNNLTRLLPICFAVNSNRCGVRWWREVRAEPDSAKLLSKHSFHVASEWVVCRWKSEWGPWVNTVLHILTIDNKLRWTLNLGSEGSAQKKMERWKNKSVNDSNQVCNIYQSQVFYRLSTFSMLMKTCQLLGPVSLFRICYCCVETLTNILKW